MPGFHLSEIGRLEAQKLARFIKRKKIKIKEIFTSPLERCREVSEIIRNEIGNPAIKIIAKNYLNEWNEGERTIHIVKRMSYILRNKSSDRLYVSHKDPIRVLLNKITNQPLREVERWHCPHGAIYEIKINIQKILPKLLFAPKVKKSEG